MSTTRKAFWLGASHALPFTLMIVPFGLLFGVVATEAGFDLLQTMAMTVLVIAGAGQFSAVAVLVDNGPVLIAVATGLAVNLRMAMYSASLAPYLGEAPLLKRALISYGLVDQNYIAAVQKYEATPAMSIDERLGYFAGFFAVMAPFWYGSTLVGALVGSAIPPEYALDFALPITFVAMVAPSLRSLPHVAAAFVSVVVSLALAFLPYNLWLLIAGILAMMTGAAVEQWMKRHARTH